MSLTIGIISYMPKETFLRTRRLKAHRKQLDWIYNKFPDTNVTVVAQCYQDDEYFSDVNYLKFDKGIGVGGARNELLKQFYRTDTDYMLIFDDDVIIYDYYDAITFIQELIINPQKFNELDIILSSTPQYNAFKQAMYEDKYNLTHYKFTVRSPYWSNEIIFFKNLKKYYNQEYFYDDDIGWHIEDAEMNIKLMRAGIKVHVADFMQMQLLLPCTADASTVFDTEQNRSIEERRLRIKLADHYNIPHSNTVKFKQAQRDWGIDFKPVYIERYKPYIIPDNLVPKKKIKTIQSLF